MTQEEKQLFLKDLSARLPHGVKVNISASRPDRYNNFVKSVNDATINSIDLNLEKCKFKEFWWDVYVVNVRPYLRPMSSMTDDEREDWYRQSKVDYDCEFKPEPTLSLEHCHLSIDWLNKYGFDYRGLIPMGLALIAPKGMYEK